MVKEVIVEVLREGQIVTVPKSLAIREEWFILREIREDVKPIEAFPVYKTLSKAKSPSKEWHSYQPDYLKNHVLNDLVDNFHWDIIRARKLKGWQRKQLAQAMQVPESLVSELERGLVPADNFVLVAKAEQVLGITLRKPGAQTPKPISSMSLADLQKMKEDAPVTMDVKQTKEVETF